MISAVKIMKKNTSNNALVIFVPNRLDLKTIT